MPSQDVVEALSRLEGSLVEALKSNQGLGLEDIVFGVVLAIVGALSAYLFNHLHWKMVEKVQARNSLLSVMSDAISRFESVAVAYWVRNQAQVDPEAEILIKARHRSILNQIELLTSEQNKIQYAALHTSLSDFSDEVFDVATGGDFESAARRASPNRAAQISRLSSDALALITVS